MESTVDDLQRRDRELVATWLFATIILGLVLLALRYSIAFLRAGFVYTGFGVTSLIWAGAWLIAGFVFGFIFGIPKVLQNAQKNAGQAGSTGNSTGSALPSSSRPYQLTVNTNLEEISDWLTKILVGATLTQLVKVPGAIKTAASFMSEGLGGPSTQSLSAAILLYFSTLGFFSGYVLTRMFFSGAFARSDPNTEQDIENVSKARLALGGTGSPTEQVQQSANRLTNVVLDSSLSTGAASAVAKSAIFNRDTSRAIGASLLALQKDPDSAVNHLNYAIALYDAGATPEQVRGELQAAHDKLNKKLDQETVEDVYNSIVYYSLYLDPPKGFEDALKYGSEYLKSYKPLDASIFINLACAFAQQYSDLKMKGSSDEASEAKKNALAMVKLALAKEPDAKELLEDLYRGTGPNPEDNDLKVFADERDPDFEAILGG